MDLDYVGPSLLSHILDQRNDQTDLTPSMVSFLVLDCIVKTLYIPLFHYSLLSLTTQKLYLDFLQSFIVSF